MSFGRSAGSSAVSRHASVRSQLPIGQHAHRQQMVKRHSVISSGRQRATLRCKSFQDKQTSVDEQERQKSSLSASCSGEEGKLFCSFQHNCTRLSCRFARRKYWFDLPRHASKSFIW